MIVLVPVLVVGPLAALVYLLVTSDPAGATWRRFVVHAGICVAAWCALSAVLRDGGLLVAFAAVVAVTGSVTTAGHGRALLTS